jgi:hypothetical protein
VSDLTSSPAAVVADTIVRTVELGLTITDAAVDGETTVVFCDLLDDRRHYCPGCGSEGVYRDTVVRKVTDVPVAGHPLRLRVRVPVGVLALKQLHAIARVAGDTPVFHCGTEDLAQQPESILDTRHAQAVSFHRRYPGTHSSAELSMR